MMIAIVGLIFLAALFNMVFYEYRVVKGLFQEPKYVTASYSKMILKKRYK